MMPVMTADGRGVMLDFRQVIFVERRGRNLIYHTRTDEYRAITSIELMAEALEPMGFTSLETKSNVVNMSAIKKYDRSYNIAYFDSELTKQSKRVHVSRENQPFVNEYIREHTSEISVIYHRNDKK